ncbi:MAG: nodulation protein NfeD [Elusimicrobia bacterium]|nr:nodulation protein NfeD [Elusimicrobiota bacterium]
MSEKDWKGLLQAAALSLLLGAPAAAAEAAKVVRLEARGAITPPMSRHLQDGIEHARAEGAAAVLIELDTPGGLLDSTREIVQAMLNSPLPIIVHVAPPGARATSAGVFILAASDAAAMAPGTHLGAAHPVGVGGGGSSGKDAEKERSVMSEKAVSDAAAYVRVLAAEKGRNAEWAERAVRESVSLTADEALAQKVVDVLARDRKELFEKLEGRRLSKGGRRLRLALAKAEVVEFPMSPLRRILQVIANPNLALLFLMIGVYGLIYEFSSPGVGFGAVVGLTSLILAGYSLSILPVNYAGLLLLLLGLVLLVLELQIPSYGLLSIGGLTILALGSFFLFDTDQAYLRLSLGVLGGLVATTGAFFTLVVAKLLKTRRLPPAVGVETLVGLVGEAREPLDPRGLVFVAGELWTAEASSPVGKGGRVKVRGVQGNALYVERLEEAHHDRNA